MKSLSLMLFAMILVPTLTLAATGATASRATKTALVVSNGTGATASAATSAAQPVAQSLVIECHLRFDDSRPDAPCGSSNIRIHNPATKRTEVFNLDGGVFTIPVHVDFGTYRIHVQPKHCPAAKDYKTALVGSVTSLTFEHCK